MCFLSSFLSSSSFLLLESVPFLWSRKCRLSTQKREGGFLFVLLSQVRSRTFHQGGTSVPHAPPSGKYIVFLLLSLSLLFLSLCIFLLFLFKKDRRMHAVHRREVEWSELLLPLLFSGVRTARGGERDTLSFNKKRKAKIDFLSFFIQMVCRSLIVSSLFLSLLFFFFFASEHKTPWSWLTVMTEEGRSPTLLSHMHREEKKKKKKIEEEKKEEEEREKETEWMDSIVLGLLRGQCGCWPVHFFLSKCFLSCLLWTMSLFPLFSSFLLSSLSLDDELLHVAVTEKDSLLFKAVLFERNDSCHHHGDFSLSQHLLLLSVLMLTADLIIAFSYKRSPDYTAEESMDIYTYVYTCTHHCHFLSLPWMDGCDRGFLWLGWPPFPSLLIFSWFSRLSLSFFY